MSSLWLFIIPAFRDRMPDPCMRRLLGYKNRPRAKQPPTGPTDYFQSALLANVDA